MLLIIIEFSVSVCMTTEKYMLQTHNIHWFNTLRDIVKKVDKAAIEVLCYKLIEHLFNATDKNVAMT